MDRRNFLRTAGLGLAAASLPGWLQACSSRTDVGGQADPGTGSLPSFDGKPASVEESLARAKALGRPLLVFVVPADESLRYGRGELLGVYLNRADVEPMADLALCEIWCAQPEEIRARIAPDVRVGDASLAVLIEIDGTPATLVAGGPLSEVQRFGEGWRDETKRVEAAKASNRFLYERLHAVIAPDRATLERRSKLACGWVFGKGTPARDRVDVPDARLAEQVPAWVRLRAELAEPRERARCMALLGDVAIRRWRTAPPPRARWARSTGCGTDIEGERSDMVKCGMGYTPEYSARFLMFLTEGKG